MSSSKVSRECQETFGRWMQVGWLVNVVETWSDSKCNGLVAAEVEIGCHGFT